jgi:DivIVA domain-containing protein
VDDVISPEALRHEVRFQVKLRGYDQVEVDELLDKVADGIEHLQRQLQQAIDRAERAEQGLADGAATDEALRRTLLLAQRVADEAVQQAKLEASRIRADATADAEATAETGQRDAEARAAEIERRLRDQVLALEGARDALQGDVEALAEYLTSERDRLRQLLQQQLERLDQLGEVSLAQAPRVHAVDLPPEAAIPPPPPAPPIAPLYDDARDDEWEVLADDHADRADQETIDEPVEAEVDSDEDAGDHDAEDHGSVDDPYFAELRRALADDEELGPREHLPADDEQPDLDLPDRARWSLRRRR